MEWPADNKDTPKYPFIEAYVKSFEEAANRERDGFKRLVVYEKDSNEKYVTPDVLVYTQIRKKTTMEVYVRLSESDDLKLLKSEIEYFKPTADGFVFSSTKLVNHELLVNETVCRQVVEEAGPKPVTYASTIQVANYNPASLRLLRDIGFKRIVVNMPEDMSVWLGGKFEGLTEQFSRYFVIILKVTIATFGYVKLSYAPEFSLQEYEGRFDVSVALNEMKFQTHKLGMRHSF